MTYCLQMFIIVCISVSVLIFVILVTLTTMKKKHKKAIVIKIPQNTCGVSYNLLIKIGKQKNSAQVR